MFTLLYHVSTIKVLFTQTDRCKLASTCLGNCALFQHNSHNFVFVNKEMRWISFDKTWTDMGARYSRTLHKNKT